MDQLSPRIPIEQYAFTKTFSLHITWACDMPNPENLGYNYVMMPP